MKNPEKITRFLKPGAGIIAALAVLTLFILIATFLKSVFFGLILAYFFLPLQKWLYSFVFKSRIWIAIDHLIATLTIPFRLIKNKISGLFIKGDSHYHAMAKKVDPEKDQIVADANRSAILTVFLVTLVALTLISSIFGVSAMYVKGVGDSAKNWIDKTVKSEIKKYNDDKKVDLIANQAVQNKQDTNPATTIDKKGEKSTPPPSETGVVSVDKPTKRSVASKFLDKLEEFKPKLEKSPIFSWMKQKVAKYLKDNQNLESFAGTLLSKSGGVFSYTAGFIGNVGAFLFNLVLTVFFFSLFLQKMAIFHALNPNHSKSSSSKFVVESIFDSPWLPDLSQEAMEETVSIIDTIIFKLKTWARSYLIIIMVETAIYVTVFLLLGVPYAIPLGLVAGNTILVPFVGPIVSGALTIIVCLVVNPGVSMVYLLLIVCVYIAMNGVIEQLFLYPALVGEALGLTTLETIIVVFLGALFAGIPGMIFAVPATSILKFLIPKSYECLKKSGA